MNSGLDTGLLLILGIVAIAVFFFEVSLLGYVYGSEERRKSHLKKRLSGLRDTIKAEIGNDLLKDKTKKGAFHNFIERLPFISNINGLIDRGGKKITVGKFAIIVMVLMGVLGGVTWQFVRDPLVIGIACLAGLVVPTVMLAVQAQRRQDSFDEQLSEALDIIIRALRAGHPFDSALKVVGEELPDPIAEEFSVAAAEISYGVDTAQALKDMTLRIHSKQLKSFVTAVLVQKETGGNLAEILSNISEVIRGGFRFQRKLNTLSAEGRMSIAVLAGTPIVLGAVLHFINPGHMDELFYSKQGHDLLKTSLVLFAMGYFWAKSIVKIEV